MVKERSDSLMKTSGGYLTTSRSVKREMQCRKYKMIALGIGVLVVRPTKILIVNVGRNSDHSFLDLRDYIQEVQVMHSSISIQYSTILLF